MQQHHYQDCIDACLQCVTKCYQSSAQELREPHPVQRCIQLSTECAVICNCCATLMSMESEKAEQIARICAEMCRTCAEECAKHPHKHCRECAEACYRCAELCTFEVI